MFDHVIKTIDSGLRSVLLVLLVTCKVFGLSQFTHEKNILGTALKACCKSPAAGFFRDGYCHNHALDHGGHLVCAVMTQEFLLFTQQRGNDLTTPHLDWGFPGLKAGDKWCLCAARWIEAYEVGVAPPIDPEATHEKLLDLIEGKHLEPYYVKL